MNFSFGRIVIGALISAVLIFFWGFFFWANLDYPDWAIKPVPEANVNELNEVLKKLPAGTYVSPFEGQLADESETGWMERYEAGPIVMLSVVPDGAPPMDPMNMAEGFLHGLIAALLAAVLLSMAAPALCCYSHRVFYVFMLGAFASIWAQPSYTIWFFRSCGATTWYVIFDLGAWLIVAIVLAGIIKPSSNADLSGKDDA